MSEFQTIPEENALLAKPKTGLRRVIVAAAALSFALGAVAATAVGGTSTANAMNFSKTNIENVHITHISSGKCLTFLNEENLEVAKCGSGDGTGHHSKQRFNYHYKSGKGRVEYRDGESYDKVLSVAFCDYWELKTGCDVILWWDEKSYKDENVHWDTSTKQIKAFAEGKDVCITKMSSTKVLWKPCHGTSDSQKWQIGDAIERV